MLGRAISATTGSEVFGCRGRAVQRYDCSEVFGCRGRGGHGGPPVQGSSLFRACDNCAVRNSTFNSSNYLSSSCLKFLGIL
jgi:hypothetical protein